MISTALLQSLIYPRELVAISSYLLSKDRPLYAKRSAVPPQDDPKFSYALCYYFLNQTSRSFARVIQSLDPELRHAVAIFYCTNSEN
jgi:farnesyl-diphosphate farnesyltransferase